MPREYGQRLQWYFPLLPSYWRGDVLINKHVKALRRGNSPFATPGTDSYASEARRLFSLIDTWT